MTDDPNEAPEVVPIEPGPHGPPRLPVNKITWPQVGRVTEPGRYMFTFGWLTVTAEDLAVWEQFPNAAFTLFRTWTTTEAGEELSYRPKLVTAGIGKAAYRGGA